MTRLIDSFQRRIDYLRVSVTDRCDLRCTYCLPKGFKGFEEHSPMVISQSNCVEGSTELTATTIETS